MIKGKKGAEVSGILIIILAALGLLAAFLYYNEATLNTNADISGLPDSVAIIIETTGNILTPIFDVIYFIVSPQQADPNVNAIAIAVFLLLTLVGMQTLRTFTNPTTAFFISAIVGVIASRSLTATVLEETALAASPIAAVSLILGFLPILAIAGNIDRLGLTQLTKTFVFVITAIIYYFVFGWVFDAQVLGIVYGIGVLALGLAQTVMPYFSQQWAHRRAEGLGSYMAEVHDDIETVRGMEEGAREARRHR